MQEVIIILIILSIYLLGVTLHLKKKLKNIICEKDMLQDKNDKIRSFKHDYINTMTSIGGYITLNDMNGLKLFYSKIFGEMSEINVMESINSNAINEPSIYNLMLLKYSTASSEGIKFNFYSMFDFKKTNICIYDLSKILGILLDNAIDAAQKSFEKLIDVSFETKKDGTQIIIIKNSYDNKEIDLNKIYEKDFSTKTIKSGFGLWEVRKILKKNLNLELNTFKDDSFFKQELIMKKI